MKAYWALKEKAREDHWRLILVSGYRSFRSQRRIWNASDEAYLKKGATDQKKRVEAVMSLASVPGLSRHHWGTDLDISETSLRGQLVNIESDTPEKVLKFYRWMEENAPKFGFCKVYLGNDGPVKHEPWHWTYLPFSKTYQKRFMAIEDFKRIFDINIEDVDYLMKNFKRILEGEKRSINPACF
jgi:LAS superfamily LD-carboxypeptidase LdcB